MVERTPLTADRVVRESQMRLEASETSSDVDSSESSTTMGNPSAGDHVSTIEDQVHTLHYISLYRLYLYPISYSLNMSLESC